MKRRTLLKALPALLMAGPVAAREPAIRDFGAIPPSRPSGRVPFNRLFGQFKGIGKGKRAHLWKLLEIITGDTLKLGEQRQEGDCIGHAYGLGADVLAAADIFMRFEPEKWVERASIEMIYAGSRVQIGESSIPAFRDGSHGEWAARFLNEFGVLHRLKYEVDGETFDLRGYDPKRSDEYSGKGVPKPLLEIAKQHPCATYSKIKTWEQARDALYLGQPVILCSSYAFDDVRDSDGFAKQLLGNQYESGPFWRRRLRFYRPKWWHAMLLGGYDETTSRPGGLILNSWQPDWITGGKRFDQPEGSFWSTPEEIERMLTDWDDCFAISSYVGYPNKFINHKLY